MIGLVLLAIALPLGGFWVIEFVQLMLLEDDLFPGRFDKALWVAAFVFALPLAPFAFLMWKSARTCERSSGARSADQA